MDEFSFEQLSEKDYSLMSREQVRYEGQISAVRYLDPEDKTDSEKLKQIITAPGVQKWMEDLDMSDADYKSWMDEKGPAKSRRHHLFAVSGSQRSKPQDIGEIQGFVYFYAGMEEKTQAQRLVDEGLMKQSDLDQKRLLEISYAKSPNAPPGRMVGGIMQSVMELSRVMQRKEDTDPKNILILAYVDPENSNSIRGIESAGFSNLGTVSGYGTDTKPSQAFSLNWDLLHQKMQESALKSVTKPISNIDIPAQKS